MGQLYQWEPFTEGEVSSLPPYPCPWGWLGIGRDRKKETPAHSVLEFSVLCFSMLALLFLFHVILPFFFFF
jgi:hypothetical protein